MSTDYDRRTAFITGLRDLAAFMEENPDVPIPSGTTNIPYIPERTTDTEMCAEIDRIAGLCGTEINPAFLSHGHYMTALCFGPVHYEAFAVLADARARYDAYSSYRGCVTPDNVPAA